MRITILCNRDLASCIALNHLLPALGEHELGVFVSPTVGRPITAESLPTELLRLRFYEQQLFNDILFPLLDASHCHNSNRLRSFAGLAELIGKPIEELQGINAPSGLARFSAQAPELVLSIRFGSILKEAALAVPEIGVLNLHSGLLPDYKGVMATFRALLNGDATIGSTLHWIDDSSIDTGRIITTTELPVTPGKSYLWHVLALYDQGCEAMLDAVHRLARNEALVSRPQSPGGNYFSFPTAAELDGFYAAGWDLVIPQEIELVAKQFMGVNPSQ